MKPEDEDDTSEHEVDCECDLCREFEDECDLLDDNTAAQYEELDCDCDIVDCDEDIVDADDEEVTK